MKMYSSMLGMLLKVLVIVTCHHRVESNRQTSLGMSQQLNHKDFLEMVENMTTVKVMLAFQVNRDNALYVDGLRVVLEDDSAVYQALMSFVQSKLQFIQNLYISEANRNAIRIAFLSALENYYNVPYGGITEKMRAACLHRIEAKPCNTGTYWFLYDLQKSLFHERAKMRTMGTHPCWATIPTDLSKLPRAPIHRHLDGNYDHEDCKKLYRYNGYFTNAKDSLDVDTMRLGNADVDLSKVTFKKDVAAVHLPARGPRLCWYTEVFQCLHWYFRCSMAKVALIADNKLRNCINISLTTVLEEALQNYYAWPYANVSYFPLGY